MREGESSTGTAGVPAATEAWRPSRRPALTHAAMQRHELLRKVVSLMDKTKTVGPAAQVGYRQTKEDEIVSFTFTVGGIHPDTKAESVAELLRHLYEALPWFELPVVKVTPPPEPAQDSEEAFARPRAYRAEFWW